eukprot:g7388.t1
MRFADEVLFSEKRVFFMKQSKDGSKVSCLLFNETLIIDLSRRIIVHRVPYKINLFQWLSPYILSSKEHLFDVTSNGSTIMIGWDAKNQNLVTLTSSMNEEKCKTLFGKDSKTILKEEDIIPCWFVTEDSNVVSFLEFNKENKAISSICIHYIKEKIVKRFDSDKWNLRTRTALNSVTLENLNDYTLHLDKSNGNMWIIGFQREHNINQSIFTPINPYNFDDCIPCLHMQYDLMQDTLKYEEFTSKLDQSLCTMMFNGKTNFQIALKNENSKMANKLLTNAIRHGASFRSMLMQGFEVEDFKGLLKHAIEDKNEFGVVYLLNLISEEYVPIEDSALMLKGGFQHLWTNVQTLLVQRINENSIAKKLCEIQVSINLLRQEDCIQARMGTTKSIDPWVQFKDQGNATTYWRTLHAKNLIDIERRGHDATTTAIVMVFLIANVCEIGLNGIIRFLLMQEAPSCIFKTPLLKWVIEYKWHKIWKKRSIRDLKAYLFFISIFTIFSIWYAFSDKDLNYHTFSSISLTTLLFVLIMFASMFLYKEYVQMKTYIRDGEELFPTESRWGLYKYLRSPWNLVEVLSYIMLLAIIVPLHVLSLFTHDVLSILFAFLALETILIWIKVWYFAQAFKKTGAFVLMIENVLKDCLPFLVLALVILIGYSFALFILFQSPLQTIKDDVKTNHSEEKDNENDEVIRLMEQSFRDPWRAMVTMFYAMIGTFESKIYYESGSFSLIITSAFITYLATQMIVMLNMLIAIMGDTFDRVKSTEEEQLLLGRARFIDACEAQLSKNEIKKIEADIGKYLYVLFPRDGDMTDEMKLWQGRVKTVEERVGKMIKESQKEVIKQVKEDLKQIQDSVNEIKDLKKDINEIKSMKEDMKQIRDTLQLVMDKVSSL